MRLALSLNLLKVNSFITSTFIGERKIKVGKAGEAQSRGPVAGGARIPVCATCQISIRSLSHAPPLILPF